MFSTRIVHSFTQCLKWLITSQVEYVFVWHFIIFSLALSITTLSNALKCNVWLLCERQLSSIKLAPKINEKKKKNQRRQKKLWENKTNSLEAKTNLKTNHKSLSQSQFENVRHLVREHFGLIFSVLFIFISLASPVFSVFGSLITSHNFA